MRAARAEHRRPWRATGLAGLLLGFVIAFGLSGLLARAGGTEVAHKHAVAMWAVAPVWLLIFSFSFRFEGGIRAWLWLGAIAALVHLALFASQFTL